MAKFTSYDVLLIFCFDSVTIAFILDKKEKTIRNMWHIFILLKFNESFHMLYISISLYYA